MNVRISTDVVCRILGGEAVMLNLATGVYFGLDDVGTRMWQLMNEHGSTERTAAALLAEYDVDEDELRRDLENLTRQLAENGILTMDAGGL